MVHINAHFERPSQKGGNHGSQITTFGHQQPTDGDPTPSGGRCKDQPSLPVRRQRRCASDCLSPHVLKVSMGPASPLEERKTDGVTPDNLKSFFEVTLQLEVHIREGARRRRFRPKPLKASSKLWKILRSYPCSRNADQPAGRLPLGGSTRREKPKAKAKTLS